MNNFIKKRVLPGLLALVLSVSMLPANGFAANVETTTTPNGEISTTMTDAYSGDEVITIAPNPENADGLPITPPDDALPPASDSTSEKPAASVPPASSDSNITPSASVSSSASSASASEATSEAASSASTPAVDSTAPPASDSSKTETGEEASDNSADSYPVQIISMRKRARSAGAPGKLVWTGHPEYQYDRSFVGSGELLEWTTATINGQIAYCVEPENMHSHNSYPYGTVEYDRLSSAQRYSIGYAMLYGAQDESNIPYHAATQTVIWEIVLGYMDLESYTCINKAVYNSIIGHIPAAAPYYDQIIANMRAHKEVPSFAHFFSALAPVHRVLGVPGEYKLDLVNTNPNCDLANFNFTDQSGVTFVKEGQTLHVSSAAAISAGTLFAAYKGSASGTNSLIFWCSTNGVDQIRATADVLDPVPAYFRLSTEDVGEYSITITKLELGTNVLLAGAEFEIRHSEKGVVGTFTTDGSGVIRVTVPWQGTYIISEITPPVNHLLDENSKKDVVVSTENKHPSVTFHNKKFSGMEILKLDAMTKTPIAGVTFRVTRKSSGQSQDVTTGTDGKAILPNLTPDWYTVTEVSCPPAYILDATPHTVELKDGETCVLTLENYAKPGLEIAKVDANDPSVRLTGATFRIARRGSQEYQDITTGADGIARLTGMAADYYVITEIIAPDGYILNDTPQTVEVVAGKVTTVTIPNGKKPTLALEKIDAITKQPLASAVFEIRYKNGESIGRFTTDETGRIELPHIAPGLVVVTEISAPAGYITHSTPQEVQLSAGETKTLTLENTPKSPVILKKVDASTGKPLSGAVFRLSKMNGELVGEYETGRNGYITAPGLEPGWYVAVEIQAPASYRLDSTPQQVELKAGVPAILEFENHLLPGLQIRKVDSITGAPLAGVRIRVTKKSGDVIGEYTTNAAGLITLPDLESGWYTAYEIATIDGYLLDTTPQDVELKDGQCATLEFKNTPLSGLTLYKVDAVTGKGLAGIVFEIFHQDGSPMGTYTTGADGRLFIPDLQEETLTLRETKTLDGYKLDTTIHTVAIKAGQNNLVTIKNAPYPYLIIQKQDSETKEPLAGATFALYSDSGNKIGTYTTNAAGRIVLTGMDEGHFSIQEVVAPDGYELCSDVFDVYLQWGKTTTITLKNEKLATLRIRKVDAETGEPMAGVTFLMYDMRNNLLGEYTTDDSGLIEFDQSLAEGKYKFREIATLEGYVLDKQVRTVTVKHGETTDIVWENKPVRGIIRIEKVAAVDNDLTKQSKGDPLAGAVFAIYNAQEELVDTITTNENGIATSKPLPLGRYAIKEVESPDGWLINDTVFYGDIKVDGDLIQFVVEDAAAKIRTHVEKRGVAEAFAGDLIRYDFRNIQNLSNVPLEDFYWHDLLPTDAVRLESIYTGTWNEKLTYKVVYRTNLKQDWVVLAEGLSTLENHKLDCSAQVLGLASNEYVTEFRFEFGTVKAGFHEETAPYIFARVLADLPNQYQFVNRTDVGGRYGDHWTYDKDAWVTITWRVERPTKLPKTGVYFVEHHS